MAATLTCIFGLTASDAPVGALDTPPTGAITPVHDPVMIRSGDRYYLYSTGFGGRLLDARTSRDLVHWTLAPSPFSRLPAWVVGSVPEATGMWAPDIAFVNGRYRLYYSVSSIGSNRSAIGLATASSLDPQARGHGWRDEGAVIVSRPQDDFNAIDPNFVVDRDGHYWLAFGSFWAGLKMVALDPATGQLLHPDARLIAIATRPMLPGVPNAIEAPFVIDRGGWYRLFASFDYCCKGADSSYYTVVGRSAAVTGPYLDKAGKPMMQGGTIVLRADEQRRDRFRGPGHLGVMQGRDGSDYTVYHAYDRDRHGAPTLRIVRLRSGADGWPSAATK